MRRKTRKKLAIILAAALALIAAVYLLSNGMVRNGPSGDPGPANTVEPETTPAESEPMPTDKSTPEDKESTFLITKQPFDVAVKEGTSAVFFSDAEGKASMEWRLISGDWTREYVWDSNALLREFSGLKCSNGDHNNFYLQNIPKELSGWYVACSFKDANGNTLLSDFAEIRVYGSNTSSTVEAKPAPTPTPEVTPAPTPEPTPEPTPTPSSDPLTNIIVTDPTQPPENTTPIIIGG